MENINSCNNNFDGLKLVREEAKQSIGFTCVGQWHI